MPTPQEILSDPNFQNLGIGDQLTVMRKADPNFSSLSKTDQGTVIARARQKFLGTDKIGLTLADNPNMGTPEPSMEPGLPGQPSQDFIGGVKDVAAGNVSRGIHKVITGAGKVGSVALPLAAVAAPIATAGSMALGYAGSKAGKAGANLLGASEDQSDLAGDVGGILGGLSGGQLASDFGAGFREGWEAAGPKAVSKERGANAPWRSLPEPTTAAPAPVVPIKGALPSGRTPGGMGDPRTLSGSSTAQKLPLWHMVRDRIVQPPPDVEPIPQTQTPSGRTPGGIQNQTTPPTRVPKWKMNAPQTPVPATETPVVQSGPVIPAQSAAELLKTAGIGIDAAEKATPEQWNLIEKHVGAKVDQQAVIDQMRSMESVADYRNRLARTRAKFNAAGKRQ